MFVERNFVIWYSKFLSTSSDCLNPRKPCHFRVYDHVNSPDIVELRVGAYSECLGVGAHGVELAVGVEFGAANSLHILESGDGNESGSAAVAAAVAGVEFRSRLLLQMRASLLDSALMHNYHCATNNTLAVARRAGRLGGRVCTIAAIGNDVCVHKRNAQTKCASEMHARKTQLRDAPFWRNVANRKKSLIRD